MKDLHCHLLYGIDDGSKSLEESIKILKDAEKSGVTEMILTPHYIEDSNYQCNNKDKETIYKELIKRVEEENINIKLYLGNEVFFTTNMINLIKKKQVQTLNKSKYVLFEFPVNNIYNNSMQVINELVSKGYIPVMAHPERYRAFQEHPTLADEYLRAGVLLQGNFTSLFGKYGKKAEKTLKFFIKNKWISFLGSDAHHEIKLKEKKLYKKVARISKDKEYADDLLYNNFDKVINNEDIGIVRSFVSR